MKLFDETSITVLFIPFILIAGIIIYEISGIEIIDVNSETGNASGTGNHVECMSMITFSTEMSESEIQAVMPESYDFDKESCAIKIEEEGIIFEG